MLSNWCQKCRFYHVVFIESFQKLWKDDVTGMLHKVTAGGRIIHMEDKEIIGILDGLISKRVRPFLWKNAKYCGGNAATTLCTCWTLWTLWTRAEQRPPWCHFEWSEVESRNLPALRSLPLLPEKAILLYFCLIVYHLTSDSLKFPQISNPPFGTAYHLFPISGWHNKVSSNLKPQTSNLKSQTSPLRPSDRPRHYTGREPERPGGHSFIPRTRAFHGNGDGRAEAITWLPSLRCTENNTETPGEYLLEILVAIMLHLPSLTR